MKYNTEGKRLTLPEYGRNIQNMVDYCVTIQDREERKRCANTIINIMGNMFPHLRDVNDFKHILWDHLAIMADFKLDIDYPYEIIKKENLYSRPPRIPYNNNRTLPPLRKDLGADDPQGHGAATRHGERPARATAGQPDEEIVPYLEQGKRGRP